MRIAVKNMLDYTENYSYHKSSTLWKWTNDRPDSWRQTSLFDL